MSSQLETLLKALALAGSKLSPSFKAYITSGGGVLPAFSELPPVPSGFVFQNIPDLINPGHPLISRLGPTFGGNIIFVPSIATGKIFVFDLVSNTYIPTRTITLPIGATPIALKEYTGTGFLITDGTNTLPSTLIIACRNGDIYGYNPALNSTTAYIGVTVPSAVLTSMELYNEKLFVTDFKNTVVNVITNTWVISTPFTNDPSTPAGLSPFTVKLLSDKKLIVAYSLLHSGTNEPIPIPLAFAVIFTEFGVIKQIVFNPGNGGLNIPSGISETTTVSGFNGNTGADIVNPPYQTLGISLNIGALNTFTSFKVNDSNEQSILSLANGQAISINPSSLSNLASIIKGTDIDAPLSTLTFTFGNSEFGIVGYIVPDSGNGSSCSSKSSCKKKKKHHRKHHC